MVRALETRLKLHSLAEWYPRLLVNLIDPKFRCDNIDKDLNKNIKNV